MFNPKSAEEVENLREIMTSFFFKAFFLTFSFHNDVAAQNDIRHVVSWFACNVSSEVESITTMFSCLTSHVPSSTVIL